MKKSTVQSYNTTFAANPIQNMNLGFLVVMFVCKLLKRYLILLIYNNETLYKHKNVSEIYAISCFARPN